MIATHILNKYDDMLSRYQNVTDRQTDGETDRIATSICVIKK